MKNIIILSGLAGSGKTYLAELIKKDFNNLFEVTWVASTKDNYLDSVSKSKEEELLIVEIHPPFPEKWELPDNFLHIVISKDWSVYKEEISKEKIKFLSDFYDKNPEHAKLDKDLIRYNEERFKHIAAINGDFQIAESISEAREMISGFVEQIRRKELFRFASKNYNYMLYHSPNFGIAGYEGTAPSMDKFLDLKLSELIGDKKLKESCLDVGCNVGFISYLLEQNHFETICAIDISEENIKCAKWLQSKFFKKVIIRFDQKDFMDIKENFDYVFALAVLHHIAKKHKFDDVLIKLGEITNKAAVIEINEMPGWNKAQIVNGLKMHFKEVKVIGNSRLPVNKQIDPKRWIIHCKKNGGI